MKLLPRVDDDVEESEWPAEVLAQSQVHHAFHQLHSMTLEQLSEPNVSAEIAAVVEAWEALMPRFRQAELAAQQAMHDGDEDDH